MAKNVLALCLVGMGYEEKGLEVMRELNESLKQSQGEDSIFYLKHFHELCTLLAKTQQFAEAEEKIGFLKKAYETRGLKLEPDYSKLSILLSAVYIQTGRPGQAKELLLEIKDLVDAEPFLRAQFEMNINSLLDHIQTQI